MSYLDKLLLGVKQFYIGGVAQPMRPNANFVGGVTAADNAVTNSTDLTVSGVAGVGAWTNAFDWDLTTAATVAGFGVDGTYLCSGFKNALGQAMSLNVRSFSNANGGNALTNGVGLNLSPASASVFTTANSNNAPGIFMGFGNELASVLPVLDWRMRFRLYVVVSASAAGTNDGNAVIASVENTKMAAVGVGAGAAGPLITSKYSLKRGHRSASQGFWCENRNDVAALSSFYNGVAIAFGTANSVMVLEASPVDPCVWGFYCPSTGTIPPATVSSFVPIEPCAMVQGDWQVNRTSAGAADAFVSDLAQWGISVRAEGGGGGGFGAVVTRIRLDYRLA